MSLRIEAGPIRGARLVDDYLAGEPAISAFYAGHPLHAPGGEPVGSLCLVDSAPRELDERERRILAEMAGWVERELAAQMELDRAEQIQQMLMPRTGLVTYDAKDPDSTYPPIEELHPPAGAPNVVLILLDDVGFGASSVFGGPCQTPVAERLAAGGLKYGRFHTTAASARP